MNHKDDIKTRLVAGWREWAHLPDLGVSLIKVKLDTGAKTSSLHAFDMVTYFEDEQEMVRFEVHPFQDNDIIRQTCVCPVVDHRWIISSTGHRQKRVIIETTLHMGDFSSRIELSLANRDEMGFRMLVGRSAMAHQILVHPGRSFLLTHKKR